MYRYAINPSKHLTICDCETTWRKDLGWDEEMYTGAVYQCQIVPCPYEDAVLSDFELQNQTIIFYEQKYLERIALEKQERLRQQRTVLLNAFDRYKLNVSVGIESDQNIKEELLNWYHMVLDLEEDAILNPPAKIKYYAEM